MFSQVSVRLSTEGGGGEYPSLGSRVPSPASGPRSFLVGTPSSGLRSFLGAGVYPSQELTSPPPPARRTEVSSVQEWGVPPSPPDRSTHGQDTLRSVCLLRFTQEYFLVFLVVPSHERSNLSGHCGMCLYVCVCVCVS